MKFIVAILALVMLAGCAGRPYGSFAEVPVGYQDIMSRDATNQMANLYPPATTRLSLLIEPKDQFGQKLIERMRLLGYAVFESSKSSLAGSKPFAYLLDTLDPITYRVSISVGNESLSRTYTVDNYKLIPNGLWTRKE